MKSVHSSLFKQCKSCNVTVSQTKAGIGLQFMYTEDIYGWIQCYCSVDLVPTFMIEKPLKLARIVNNAQ
jgi:hypothetical protein